jgi:hypothetical protein
MSVQNLTKQDINIFDDSQTTALGRTRDITPRNGAELHWPNLALADEYPVTDRDGRILRHESVKGNEDLI